MMITFGNLNLTQIYCLINKNFYIYIEINFNIVFDVVKS